MAMRGVDFKWYDGFFLSMLATIVLPVPENAKLLAWVGDEIVPREMAKVSVIDSVVQGGDSVWEGLRI